MSKVIKVGAAQISPKFFDKQQTLEKTCQYIEEGGKLGLDLLVFPEAYFCGYPFWRGGGIGQAIDRTSRANDTDSYPLGW